MENNSNCPGTDCIIEYFSNVLDKDKRKEVEEHFYICDKCTDLARDISESFSRQRIAKARPFLGLAWERFGDSVEVKAAGENNSHKIRELLTKNGKFRITLRPLESNPTMALLEIEVLDHSIKGQLKVLSINQYREIVEIDDHYLACTVVNSSIDLDRIIINKHEP